MPSEDRLNVGDKVRWVRAVLGSQYSNAVGVVVLVIPDDRHSREFSMYEVQFSFGLRTLYGTQIEAADANPRGSI